jgi:hypothetical protein
MAKRIAIPFKELKVRIASSQGEYQAARIQRLDIPVTWPSRDIDELGNRLHAGTVTDPPEVTATFQAMDVSIKLFSAITGTNAAAFPGAGVDVNEIKEFDVIADVKDAVAEELAKSIHIRRARVTSFTYTYTVGGESTEEYTCDASEKHWLKYDVIVDKYTTGTGFTLSQTPLALKNGKKLLSVIVDGEFVEEGPDTDEYSVSGTTLTLGTAAVTSCVAIYHANVGTDWTDIGDATIPAGITGTFVPVVIATNTIPRVQSVTLRGTFPATKIKEMGNRDIVGTIVGVTGVEGDISVLDTDLELISLFTEGSISVASNNYSANEFTYDGIDLEIKLYDPAYPIASGIVLKTVYLPEIEITSEGHTTAVGDNATQTFNFKSKTGALVIYSGSR